MKNLITFLLIILLPGVMFGQLFQLRSTTSAYVWQKPDNAAGTMSNHLFGYQGLHLNVAKSDVSFNTYMLGLNDFSGPVKNDAQLRLQSLNLQVRNVLDLGDLVLGRQAVFAGAGVGTMDGLKAVLRFPGYNTRIVAFGGGLIPAKQKAELHSDLGNNYMAGGQVIVQPMDWLRTSVSFFSKSMSQQTYKAIRTDSLNNVTQTFELKPDAMQEQILSGDVEAEYNELVSGHVRCDVDTREMKLSRIELFTRVHPMEDLAVTLEYLDREPRLFYNSLFSVFAYSTLKEIQGGVEYQLCQDIQLFGKVGSLSYGDETETNLSLGGNWSYVSGSISHSFGSESRISAASFNAGYPLFENVLTPNLLLNYAQYKLAENAPADGALTLGVGVTYRPIRTFSFDTQVQWNQNKILANDTRLFIRVNYFLSQQLGIF